MTEAHALPLAVLAPLAVGVAAFVLPERAARALFVPGWVLTAAAVAAVATAGSPLRYALGAWGAPMGIELAADGISVALLGLSAAVYAAVFAYALAYFERGSREAAYFWPLAWLLWGAMNALALSADLFNLFVTLELLGLASVGLAALSGKAAALAAALRYLLAALVGSNLFLLAVALLYGATGVLALDAIGARLQPGAAAALAAGLITVALALKTALVPLHFWLPPAHGGAVTPVSALLSALVIKGSFVILLRLWLLFAPAFDAQAVANLLAVLGSAAILWGSLAALVQKKIKMLVAYSTVAQVGYLFLVFALMAGDARLALEGGVLHLVAHGLAKAAMFLAAGSLVLSAGRDDLAALRGAAARQPLAVFAFGLAGASLIGLPPSAGFAAKWQLLRAALESGQWWWALVLVAGGLLAAAYLFRVLRLAFLPRLEDNDARPLAPLLSVAPFALALTAAFGGLAAAALLARLDLVSPLAAWIR
jgi:formate hydrogenlyase subunit 3/multisubunit Na+/H+ antiporter MnhD subunit